MMAVLGPTLPKKGTSTYRYAAEKPVAGSRLDGCRDSEPDGALETPAIGEHVDVREHVVGVLVLGSFGDFREALYRGIFIPGLMPGWTRQPVVSVASFRETVLERVTGSKAARFFSELIRLFWIPPCADVEDHRRKSFAHHRQEVPKSGLVRTRMSKIRWSEKNRDLRVKLFLHQF